MPTETSIRPLCSKSFLSPLHSACAKAEAGSVSLPSGDDIHAYFSDCLLHVPKALLLQCFRLAFGPKPCMSTNSDFSTSKTHMIKGVRTWVRKGIAWRILGPFLATAPSEDHRPAALQSVGRDCCQPSQGTLGHPLYIYIYIMCIYIYISPQASWSQS